MKRIVSHLLIANIFVSLWTIQAKATPVMKPEGDTIIVRLKNKNQVLIITDKSKDLGSFKWIDLNQMVADIDSSLRTNSSTSDGADVKVKIGNKDSLMIVRKKTGTSRRNSYKAVIMINDESSDDTTYREVRKSENRKFNFDFNSQKSEDLFELDLGWNNYLENGSLPSDNNRDYGLRPFNSNVVALRYLKTVLGKPSENRLTLRTGLELSFINYKYDNRYIIRKASDKVVFEPFPPDQKMIKSKLAITWLNLPVMVHYRAKKSSFHIAAGGYAGFRLSSHSKIKYEKEGATRKDKNHSNFYLNSFQYGLRFQVGFHDVDFFATYNLNALFSKNSGGPTLTPISFGFTL